MTQLSNLPNIGKTLEELLISIDITTEAQLKEMGTEQTFVKIKEVRESACINMLYAIEGAIQGIRWHGLSAEKKKSLKDFYNTNFS